MTRPLSRLLLLLVLGLPAAAAGDGGYVGTVACGSCHEAQVKLWRGSDHDRAMQKPTAETVAGNFDGATFAARGFASTFAHKDGQFSVETQGADGKLHTYPIAYTFGFKPLQQYLVAFPAGAYQALTTAWDTRPQSAGGQRWFDLYPDETTPPGDVLHWTGPANNWNRMCADCHSTNVRTRYVVAERRYETAWSEINVACEACHGPGERHVAWAKARVAAVTPPAGNDGNGLAIDLGGSTTGSWVMSGATGIAQLDKPRASRAEIQTCAPCHSRRARMADQAPGEPFLDAYRPALLDEGLYFADGQMEDEVYVWGSFVQSRMFHAGVTCGDCHDPHSLRLRAEGNALCGRCHAAAKFDTAEHHHHARASRGALCVECHMPARTYMVVDPRRDHSFRVPRPDLAATVGAPNACTSCHREQTPEWASKAIRGWNGKAPREHFATALAAGRSLGHGTGKQLTDLIADDAQPAIARATALGLLPAFAIEDVIVAVHGTTDDDDALVRAAAAAAAGRLPPQLRVPLIQPLLDDRTRLVRLEAARALVASRSQLDGTGTERLDRVLDEYKRAQVLNADQPQAHLNLGALAAEMGLSADAERDYTAALEIGPYFIPAYVNLADLYRGRGQEKEAEAVLRKGLERAPEDASLHHSLGLTLVRQGQSEQALAELRRAHELAPDEARYAYVYGIALNSLGQRDAAIKALTIAYAAHPADADIAIALATMQRDAGDTAEALKYARQLAAEWPNSRAAQQLAGSLSASPQPRQAATPPRL